MRRPALLLCIAMLAGCRRDPHPSLVEAAEAPAPVSFPAPAAPAFDRSAFTAAVDALAADALARGPVAGFSIAVERGHDVLLAKGYGLADIEAGRPATADSSYPIASVSKNFTTAAVFQLAEQGRLDLDAPLGSVVEEARPAAGAVTLRHFLNHTSGLAVRGGPSPRTRAVRALRAAVIPGGEFEYSNTGFAVMGLVIERASGLSYPQYIDRMTAALGLTSTGYCEGGRDVPNRARDYGVGREGLKPSPYWQYEKFFAAGGLCSSVNDLLRWEHALDEGRVIGAADRRAMLTPTVLEGGVEIGYGLGTRMGDTGGHRKLGHTGGGTSNKAVLAHYPDDDVTIVVLLNTEAYVARVTAMEIEDRVARLLFGLPAESPSGSALSLEQLERYSGAYSEHGRTTRVVVDRPAQRLAASGFGPLLHQGGDAFVDERDPAVTLQFVASGDRVHGYLRRHAGWFVQFGRRTGEAGSAPLAPPRKHLRSRRRRRAASAGSESQRPSLGGSRHFVAPPPNPGGRER